MRRKEPPPLEPSRSRALILEFVQRNPGAYFNQVLRATGLATGEATYHLDVLLREGSLSVLRLGNYKHFFPRDRFSISERNVLSVLALRFPREILLRIAQSPGTTATDIARFLETGLPNILWHLRRLKAANLIVGERHANAIQYRCLLDPASLRAFLESYHPNIWKVWSEQFVEAWEKLAARSG